MKKAYIIHGYGGYPEKNWFPWLKTELEKMGVEVHVPAMPNTDTPEFFLWLSHLQSQINSPDEHTYLIGHSLGCITILQYLNSLPRATKIGGVVLVAAFSKPIHFTELNGFFETPLDEQKIQTIASEIVVINSDNDEHVPFEQAEEIRDRFDAELIKIEKGGHLNAKTGYTQFPLVLEKLKEMM